MNEEMIKKAKEAKTAQELLALAREHGMDLTEEQAEAHFAQLHAAGELADDELDNVAGGGCTTSGGYTVVSSGVKCFTGRFEFVFTTDGWGWKTFHRDDHLSLRKTWVEFAGDGTCGSCCHLEFTSAGTGYCGVSK